MSKLGLFRSKIIKSKIIFLGIPFALISLEIYFGILFGYLMSRVFAGKQTGQQGLLKSLTFQVGKYRLHLHHWLIGVGVFISGIWYLTLPFPQFSFGFLGGCIYHGIFSYSDWHKIIKKDQNIFKQFYDFGNQKISQYGSKEKKRENRENNAGNSVSR